MGRRLLSATVHRYVGRDFTDQEIALISGMCSDPATPTREAIARAACEALSWRSPNGAPKTMSAKVAFLRMHKDGLITLPEQRGKNTNGRAIRHLAPDAAPRLPFALPRTLEGIGELHLRLVKGQAASSAWNEAIARHHYLGYVPLAGAQLRYLVEADCGLLAALSFGASAWKCAARDNYIGWDAPTREPRLHLVVNNARFLIMPEVHVPHLASKILGRVTRRLPTDWQAAYGYAPVLVETFVEKDRFAGTSYKAANWALVGETQGRGKLDRLHARALPVKDVYLYPLHRAYGEILTAPL
ncbi:MAG: Druantia anti-phage system protein DruA [Acidimicrobiales bacterium]